MTDRPLPGEERLGRLIHEAYEYMPGPDMSRLYQLQNRLHRQVYGHRVRAARRLPWWITLLLVSGAAAAAWWGGVTLLHRRGAEPAPRPPAPATEAPRDHNGGTRAAPDSSQKKDDSPVIYQREGF